MKTFKTRGVVLREYEAGESDKRLVLLCKEHGRLTVYARGARKHGSKFLAAAQLFTYGDFILADGRQFLSLTQADVIESFFDIRGDYESFRLACYAAEICERTVLENTACDDLLRLLLKTLSRFNRRAAPPKQDALVFLFRFYLCYGLRPAAGTCCLCGAEPAGGVFFCDEGVICAACAPVKPYKTPLSKPALAALRHILESDLSGAFMFNAGGAVINELSAAGELFWNSHFQIDIKARN